MHSTSSASAAATATASWMSLGSVLFSVPARTVKYVAYISGQTSDTFAVYCRRGACQNLTHPHPPTHTHTIIFMPFTCPSRTQRLLWQIEAVLTSAGESQVRSSQFAYFIIHFPSLFHYYFHFHIFFFYSHCVCVCVCPIVVSLTNCFKLHFHNVFLCGLKYLPKA